MTTKRPRKFVIWADVHRAEDSFEMPADASDEECEEACRDALDNLIANGDTGWNEIHEDGSES